MSPEAIELVEVGPRDGLQNEPDIIASPVKLQLIDRMIGYGARRIEVASFVHPARVPQMADAADVFAGITRRPDGLFDVALGDGALVAHRVVLATGTNGVPIRLGDRLIVRHASAGIAMVRPRPATADDLICEAETALGLAKLPGGRPNPFA